MTDTKHMPTPWGVYQFGGVQIGQEDTGAAICSMWRDKHEGEANAAHIVKCVNMHDELVGLLQWFVDNDETNEGDEPLDNHNGQTWDEINSYWIGYLNRAREAPKKAGAL